MITQAGAVWNNTSSTTSDPASRNYTSFPSTNKNPAQREPHYNQRKIMIGLSLIIIIRMTQHGPNRMSLLLLNLMPDDRPTASASRHMITT
jgi:hypothetical protein